MIIITIKNVQSKWCIMPLLTTHRMMLNPAPSSTLAAPPWPAPPVLLSHAMLWDIPLSSWAQLSWMCPCLAPCEPRTTSLVGQQKKMERPWLFPWCCIHPRAFGSLARTHPTSYFRCSSFARLLVLLPDPRHWNNKDDDTVPKLVFTLSKAHAHRNASALPGSQWRHSRLRPHGTRGEWRQWEHYTNPPRWKQLMVTTLLAQGSF